MNSIRNGLGMRETQIVKEPTRPWKPHFYAIFASSSITRSRPNGKENWPWIRSSTITAGLDLGGSLRPTEPDRPAESGDVIEEGRIPTNPRALQRRFSGSEPMRVATEGRHSLALGVSRLLP